MPAGANVASLLNFGVISGSVGDYSGNGGIGVYLLATVLACDFRADLAQAGMGRGRCAFFFKPAYSLEAAALPGLRIRCAATGEELAMTSECRAVIDAMILLAA